MADQEAIELFVQGEGIDGIALVQVPIGARVLDIAALSRGGAEIAELSIWLEEEDTALEIEALVAATPIRHRSRIHLHRCRHVAVTVSFNGLDKGERFPPSATIKRVARWATGKHGFDLTDRDATEHALQLRGSGQRPDEDIHLGALTAAPVCTVAFDLVPKQRVEGGGGRR